MDVNIALDEKLASSGVLKYIKWDYTKYPHMAIFGSTGSGKTYGLKLLLAKIGLHIPDSEMIVCDFKSDSDFSFLKGSKNFFRFNDCINGLEKVVKILSDRQQELTTDRFPVFFVFDEFASFITSLEKKQADYAKQSLSLLLMLGRSFNVHVIVSQQRLDSTFFNNSRDNFSVVLGMGTLSKEAVYMMYSDQKDIINPSKDRGHGSLLIGSEFYDVLIPRIRNRNKLHRCILSAVRRTENRG